MSARKRTSSQKERLLLAAADAYGVEGDHPFSGDSVTTVLENAENRIFNIVQGITS